MNVTNEIVALKHMFHKDNFIRYRKYFDKLELEEEHSLVFETLSDYYEENPETWEVSLNDFRVFLNLRKPLAKTKDMVLEVLDSLDKCNVREELINEVMTHIIRTHYAAEIIQALTPALDGTADEEVIDEATDFMAEYEEATVHLLNPENPDEKYVTKNLRDLLASQVLGTGIPWGLHCLDHDLGPLRGGSLGHVFARPDTGKTSFLAHIASQMALFMQQEEEFNDANILWFNNEEAGEKVQLRVFSAVTNMSKAEMALHEDDAAALIDKRGGHRINIIDEASISVNDIERELKANCVFKDGKLVCKSKIVIIDQGDKVKLPRSGDMATHERLKALYGRFRELAKQYKCDIITAGQANADATGKKWLRMDNMDNSKVGKPGELDYAIGIGFAEDGPEYARYICLCKNKMQDGNHGRYTVAINVMTARFIDKPVEVDDYVQKDTGSLSTEDGYIPAAAA